MRKVFLLLCFVLASTSMQAQSYDLLRDSLRRATNEMEYHPDSADLRLKKAGINLLLEQWQLAKEEYDYVLRLEPDNPAALYFRAYANEKLRRYHFARLDYEALLQLVPGNFEARLGLALLNQKDKHYTEAYNQLNLLAEVHPDSAVVFAARAGLEEERGMLELAEYDYSKALSLQPDQADWLLSRANLRLQLKRKADAEDDLDRLVALGTPRSSLEEYYQKLGKGKKRSKKKRDAILTYSLPSSLSSRSIQ